MTFALFTNIRFKTMININVFYPFVVLIVSHITVTVPNRQPVHVSTEQIMNHLFITLSCWYWTKLFLKEESEFRKCQHAVVSTKYCLVLSIV
jgi:hypothetical protein